MYRCEWDLCRKHFWSVIDLERHCRNHIDQLDSNNDENNESVSEDRQKLPPSNEPTSPTSPVRIHEPSLGNSSTKETNSVNRSKDQNDIVCQTCKGGRESRGNHIVLCDGCETPYHQKCHRPTISSATVNDHHAKWYCRKCSSKRP
jgi:hypothetical protein